MAEAHVVVGKAGGLTVSEALTAGRPMIIAGAVPGNEAINANLVARADAGVIAEPGDVGMVVERDAGAPPLRPHGSQRAAPWS